MLLIPEEGLTEKNEHYTRTEKQLCFLLILSLILVVGLSIAIGVISVQTSEMSQVRVLASVLSVYSYTSGPGRCIGPGVKCLASGTVVPAI